MDDNKKEKLVEIIASLESLKDHPGWKFIVKTLKTNIKDAEEQMFDDNLIQGIPDVERCRVDSLRKKRNERINLKDLPETLIKIYSDPETKLPEFDPYE